MPDPLMTLPLTHLDLAFNDITKFDALIKIVTLDYLNLANNAITDLPKNI
jgi:Leucine-rich repeat (LRR) protein